MVLLFAVVVSILQEEVLVEAVPCERDRRGPQAGQRAPESVPAREGARVSPSLPAAVVSSCLSLARGRGAGGRGAGVTNARSQGSYRGWPAASLKARMLKPVMLALGPRAASRTLCREEPVVSSWCPLAQPPALPGSRGD